MMLGVIVRIIIRIHYLHYTIIFYILLPAQARQTIKIGGQTRGELFEVEKERKPYRPGIGQSAIKLPPPEGHLESRFTY